VNQRAIAIAEVKAGPESDERLRLAALSKSGLDFQFLDAAYRYLHETPSDPQIVLLTLQALVKVGLGVPARELLQTRKDLEGHVDIAELRKSLVPVPTGRVGMQELEETFKNNLNALISNRPELAKLKESIRDSLHGLDFFRSSNGQLHLSQRKTGELRQWLPGLFDHKLVETLELPIADTGPAPIVIGLAMNCLADRAYQETSPQTPGAQTKPVFIIDLELRHLVAWLCEADHTNVLNDNRVYFFIGDDALKQYELFLTNNEDISIATAHLCASWAGNLSNKVQEIGELVTVKRTKSFDELTAKHKARASDRTPTSLAKRIEPGSGARILGFTSRFTTMLQYSMRDIGHALEELGYEFELMIEKDAHRDHTTLTTSRSVYESDAALVIMINHFRSERPNCIGGVPVLSWLQDPTELVFSDETGKGIGPLDFVCGYYLERCVRAFNYPAESFFPATVPVSTRIFHNGPVDPENQERYQCDVMYVGHLHVTIQEHLEKWLSQTPPRIHPLLNQIYEQVSQLHERGDFLELQHCLAYVKTLLQKSGATLPDNEIEKITNFYMYRLFDILFRTQTLHWVVQWAEKFDRSFRLYGNGWEKDPILSKYAVGSILHGENLRCAYRCAKLCIQTIPGGFKHQRAFEALASGSLVLGRYIPPDFGNLALDQYLNHQRDDDHILYGSVSTFGTLDRVVFDSAEGFASLAEKYITNANLCKDIQQKFASTVHKKFTYTRAMRDLLNKIRANLAAQDKTLRDN